MKFKILYALSDNPESVEICRRFLEFSNSAYNIKIAAYCKSSMPFYVDWNLEACEKFYGKKSFSPNNQNFEIYFNQVKNFNTDLIICDLEKYTTYISNILNITTWQLSPFLLYDQVRDSIKFNKYYRESFSRTFGREDKSINNFLVKQNEHKIIYTNLVDYDSSILKEADAVRPYFYLGKKSIPCRHNFVTVTDNLKAINFSKLYSDGVIFSKYNEDYNNLIAKDYYNSQDYSCNIYNSEFVISDGDINFLSDAFYNNKFCFIFPQFNYLSNIVNSFTSQHFGLSKVLFNYKKINIEDEIKNFSYEINNKYLFLHEKINKDFNI